MIRLLRLTLITVSVLKLIGVSVSKLLTSELNCDFSHYYLVYVILYILDVVI